jgi:hypothetical protein
MEIWEKVYLFSLYVRVIVAWRFRANIDVNIVLRRRILWLKTNMADGVVRCNVCLLKYVVFLNAAYFCWWIPLICKQDT